MINIFLKSEQLIEIVLKKSGVTYTHSSYK